MYTLVMAAFMLVGAKLGDIYGRDRIFAIGLAVYGLGSLTTAISPNLTVLLFGWSLVEGLGAVMVIPAIAALVVSNYEGKDRALAYGIIGGVAGAAIAVGPLIGGWVTTDFSWRYVFAGEAVIVIGSCSCAGACSRRRGRARPKLDYVGAALSAAGLGIVVFGILKTSEWGWIKPLGALTISGHEITPFGFSVVPFLIPAGLGILGGFADWEERRDGAGRTCCSTARCCGSCAARRAVDAADAAADPAGHVLRAARLPPGRARPRRVRDGQAAVPDVADDAARRARRAAARRRLAPKRVGQIGLVALMIASFLLVGTVDVELNETGFAFALALFGIGAGLLLSQLGNVIMSSVDPAKSNEAGGLQGTAQNLGASLGTALIGAVLIAGLTTGFVTRIEQTPRAADVNQRSRSRARRASRSCRSTTSSRRSTDGAPARPGGRDRRRLRRRAA